MSTRVNVLVELLIESMEEEEQNVQNQDAREKQGLMMALTAYRIKYCENERDT